MLPVQVDLDRVVRLYSRTMGEGYDWLANALDVLGMVRGGAGDIAGVSVHAGRSVGVGEDPPGVKKARQCGLQKSGRTFTWCTARNRAVALWEA